MAERADERELLEHFGSRLQFGTAGLRALVGPGPARMNLAMIRTASFAVGSYLTSTLSSPLVVLAYDARATSTGFARECAGVLRALGVRVVHFAEPTPTPIAAFAVRHLRADAAIVVTASHNPKQYNGFKLYAADGCQIVPPVDGQIARNMALAPAACDISCLVGDVLAPENAAPQSVIEAYYAAVRGLYTATADNVVVAYTALHGVGGKVATRALSELGVKALYSVPSQHEPDPAFSTVAFPNPEEPGVMDLVMQLAEQVNAHVALATDPDADRLGVAVRDDNGRMLQLNGNQVGLLLAHRALERHSGPKPPLVVQSVVSSPMLAEMARAWGARYERTLTGFKWICRPALALPDHQYVFGYEEALGYSVSSSVLDKDGVSAAVAFVDLVAHSERNGRRVAETLFELSRRFGLWVSAQHTVKAPGVDGARRMATAMDVLRANPPATVGVERVSAVTDYACGGEARPPWLGASNLIELELGSKGRILIRPSGTEPKLKLYVDFRAESPDSFTEYFARQREVSAYCLQLAAQLAAELSL